MTAVAQLSIFPVGKDEGLSPFVARAVRIIADSGLDYQVGSMGTVMEGPWPMVMQTVSACMEDLQNDCDRVYMVLSVDWRKGPSGRIKRKTESVMEKIRAC